MSKVRHCQQKLRTTG